MVIINNVNDIRKNVKAWRKQGSEIRYMVARKPLAANKNSGGQISGTQAYRAALSRSLR